MVSETGETSETPLNHIPKVHLIGTAQPHNGQNKNNSKKTTFYVLSQSKTPGLTRCPWARDTGQGAQLGGFSIHRCIQENGQNQYLYDQAHALDSLFVNKSKNHTNTYLCPFLVKDSLTNSGPTKVHNPCLVSIYLKKNTWQPHFNGASQRHTTITQCSKEER